MISICYTADSKYAMQVAVSMVSVLENNRNNKVHFYILGDDYDEDIKSRFASVESQYHTKIDIINIKEKMLVWNRTELIKEPGIVNNGVISYMFARLFIGSSVPDDVEKIIYMDCDTIYINDIGELYNTPIQDDYIFAAVRDIWPASYNEAIGLSKKDLYFQSGIMLIDLKKWRNENCEKSLLKAAGQAKHYYFMHDQDLINICFHGRIQTLSPKYGMIYLLRHYSAKECLWFSDKDKEHYYSISEINNAKSDIHVIHYAGDYYGRPWVFPEACKDNKEWLKYYMLTPWKTNAVGNRHSCKELLKFYLKKLAAPFVKKIWLKRTKKKFTASNEWMLKQSISNNG